MHRSPSDAKALRGLLGVTLLALAASTPHAQIAGDARRGAKVFAAECAECHSVRPNKNKKGPTLFGIVDRRAGEVPQIKYSDAMRRSGWTWDGETLRRYIRQPRRALPGGKMKYDGLPEEQDLENLLAYLATVR